MLPTSYHGRSSRRSRGTGRSTISPCSVTVHFGSYPRSAYAVFPERPHRLSEQPLSSTATERLLINEHDDLLVCASNAVHLDGCSLTRPVDLSPRARVAYNVS